jgi:hypothetical protein
MRDLKFLNDLFKHENESDDDNLVLDGWCNGNPGTPVLCIFEGQVPTVTTQDVILWNFLKNAVLGFAVTEKCTVINPVVECEPGPADSVCPGCDKVDVCPEHCDDPPDLDDDVEACENCFYIQTPLWDEPCDGCFGCDKWEPQNGNVKEGPAPCADEAESLYKAGCWVTLENRLHDLMSEWSMAAPDCTYQNDFDDVIRCNHGDVDIGTTCHFNNCPRVKS